MSANPAPAAKTVRVPFGDLKREFAELRVEIEVAIAAVLERGRFILGDELSAFESEFAAWLGARHAIGCASGTDAIMLALRALEIGAGDEVILPVNTCVPTAAAIRIAGAKPVPVDIDPRTLLMDIAAVRRAVTPKTKAIVPVHLYGGPVDMDGILSLGIPVVEDCAQAQGTSYRGRKTGTLGVISCFSFYPSKNLGAYGDAGAIATDDEKLGRKLKALRQYGQESRYLSVYEGYNSRLDELQAAILRVKLRHLDRWNGRRRQLAELYCRELRGVEIPQVTSGGQSVYHLFPVLADRRDDLIAHLAACRIDALIHYPVPLHLQPAYKGWGFAAGAFPIAERAADRLVTLPMFPQLTDVEALLVAAKVREFYRA